MKTCFKCNTRKKLEDFYKHPEMKDGHLGKCKECAKEDVRVKFALNCSNPDFVKKERKRGRDKYFRLNYRLKCKTSTQSRENYKNKYPEKWEANLRSRRLSKKGFHCHHWSYNEEHFKDIIYLIPAEHYKLHRFITYSQPDKMYKTLNGTLLDTKRKHLNYFNKIKKLN